MWYCQLCPSLEISFRLKLYYLSYITTVQKLYWYVVSYFLCPDLDADTTACLPYLNSDLPLHCRYADGSTDSLTLTSVSDPYPHTCCPASCFWLGRSLFRCALLLCFLSTASASSRAEHLSQCQTCIRPEDNGSTSSCPSPDAAYSSPHTQDPALKGVLQAHTSHL